MAKVAAKDLNIGDKVRYTIKDDSGAYRSLSWTVAEKQVEGSQAEVRLERPETWLKIETYAEEPVTVTKSKSS